MVMVGHCLKTYLQVNHIEEVKTENAAEISQKNKIQVGHSGKSPLNVYDYQFKKIILQKKNISLVKTMIIYFQLYQNTFCQDMEKPNLFNPRNC